MKIQKTPVGDLIPFVPDVGDNRDSDPPMVWWIRPITDAEAQSDKARALRAAASGSKTRRFNALAKAQTEQSRQLLARHVERIENLTIEDDSGSSVEVTSGKQLVDLLGMIPAGLVTEIEAATQEAVMGTDDEGFTLGRSFAPGS